MQAFMAIVPDAIDVYSISEVDEWRLRWKARVGIWASDEDAGILDDQWHVLHELFPGLLPLAGFCVPDAVVVCVVPFARHYIVVTD